MGPQPISLTPRERFQATMHYQPRDRAPIMDFGFWGETRVIWGEQGMPESADPNEFLGMDPQWIIPPLNLDLCPNFGHEVLEDYGDTWLVRDIDGVTKIKTKFLGTIPRMVSHALRDRATWEEDFKWRLDGKDPARYPENWEEIKPTFTNPDRDYPIGLKCGSLYGYLRDKMGLEAISMLVYDDRKLFAEMVETLATLIIDAITPMFEQGIRFDYAMFWEDMCYRGGPLLSPKIFKQTMVPQYKRVTSLLKSYGTDVVIVDSDGDITRLAPLWLESGVNTMFPLEVGTWQADPYDFRSEYGKEMLLIGGVDKRILKGPREGIRAEVERLAPLVEEGGYIPTPDHLVPPDVPLKNYLYYLEQAKAIWGHNLPNLKPAAVTSESLPEPDFSRYAWGERTADDRPPTAEVAGVTGIAGG